VVIADQEYPARVAHTLMNKVRLVMWDTKQRPDQVAKLRKLVCLWEEQKNQCFVRHGENKRDSYADGIILVYTVVSKVYSSVL